SLPRGCELAGDVVVGPPLGRLFGLGPRRRRRPCLGAASPPRRGGGGGVPRGSRPGVGRRPAGVSLRFAARGPAAEIGHSVVTFGNIRGAHCSTHPPCVRRPPPPARRSYVCTAMRMRRFENEAL